MQQNTGFWVVKQAWIDEKSNHEEGRIAVYSKPGHSMFLMRDLRMKSNLEEGLIAVGEQVLGLLRVNANDSEQEMTSGAKGDLHLENGGSK